MGGSHRNLVDDDDDDFGAGTGPRAKRKKSDIVALFVNTKSEGLDITYFTKETLKEFLFADRKDLHGFLQMWVEPRLNNSDLVQVTYSPGQTFALRRVNRTKIYDQSVSAQARCSTFDGPIHQSEELFCLPHVTHIHQQMCEAFVRHFSLIDPRHAIDRLVAYFRQDANEQYWMLFTTSVRIVEKVDQELAELLVSKKRAHAEASLVEGKTTNPATIPGVSESFATLLTSGDLAPVDTGLSKLALDEGRRVWAKHMKSVPEPTKANTSNTIMLPPKAGFSSSSSLHLAAQSQPPVAQRDLRQLAVLHTVQNIGNNLLYDRFKKSRTLLKHRIPVALYMKDLNVEERHLMSFQKYELDRVKRERKKASDAKARGATPQQLSNQHREEPPLPATPEPSLGGQNRQFSNTSIVMDPMGGGGAPDPYGYNPLHGIDSDLVDRIKYNKKGRGGASREGALGTAKGKAGGPRVDRYNSPNPNLKTRPVPARLLSGFYTNSADLAALRDTITGSEEYSDSDDPLVEYYMKSNGDDEDSHSRHLLENECGSEGETESAMEGRQIHSSGNDINTTTKSKRSASRQHELVNISNLSQRELFTVSKVATIQRLRSQRDAVDLETRELEKSLKQLQRDGRKILSTNQERPRTTKTAAASHRLSQSAQPRIGATAALSAPPQDDDSFVLNQISIIRSNGNSFSASHSAIPAEESSPSRRGHQKLDHASARGHSPNTNRAPSPLAQKSHIAKLKSLEDPSSRSEAVTLEAPVGKASKSRQVAGTNLAAATVKRSYYAAAEAIRKEASIRCVECSDLSFPIFEALRLLKRVFTLRSQIGGPASGSLPTVEEELRSLLDSTRTPGGCPMSVSDSRPKSRDDESSPITPADRQSASRMRKGALEAAEHTSLIIADVDASLLWFMDQHLPPGFLASDLRFEIVDSRDIPVRLRLPAIHLQSALDNSNSFVLAAGIQTLSGDRMSVQSYLMPTETERDRTELMSLRARQLLSSAPKANAPANTQDDEDITKMIEEIKAGEKKPPIIESASPSSPPEEEREEKLLTKRVVTLRIAHPFPCLSTLSLLAASLQRATAKHAKDLEDEGDLLASKLVPGGSVASSIAGKGAQHTTMDAATLHAQILRDVVVAQRHRAMQAAAVLRPANSGLSATSKTTTVNRPFSNNPPTLNESTTDIASAAATPSPLLAAFAVEVDGGGDELEVQVPATKVESERVNKNGEQTIDDQKVSNTQSGATGNTALTSDRCEEDTTIAQTLAAVDSPPPENVPPSGEAHPAHLSASDVDAETVQALVPAEDVVLLSKSAEAEAVAPLQPEVEDVIAAPEASAAAQDAGEPEWL